MHSRVATYDDVAAIEHLEEMIFSVPWSKEAIESEMANPVATYMVMEEEEQVIGYVGIWCVLDEGQITNVAVHPNYRKQGIGKKLIETILVFGKEQGITNYLLEVRESNEAAIGLYKGMGFEQIGLRKNYYDKPKEHALLMQKLT